MNAVSFLEQYHKCEVLILNKQSEVDRWRDIAGSIGSFNVTERVQSSGSQSKIADAVAEYTALEEDIKRLKDKQRDILNVIESLESREYGVLYKVYIIGVPLKEVATLNCFSYDWAYKWYKKGIASVQKILDDRIN